MKKYFLITVSLLVTLAVLSGCMFRFFVFENTEPATETETAPPTTTEASAFSAKDVPELLPDPLGIREAVYEETPTFDNLNDLSKYFLWNLLNNKMKFECYLSKDFAEAGKRPTALLDDACRNALAYHLFGGYKIFDMGTSYSSTKSAYYATVKLYNPDWEKDLEAKAKALEYIENHPIPENGFKTSLDEQRYAKNVHDFIAKKVIYAPDVYTSEDLTGSDAYENMQEAWNVLSDENDEAVCAAYARAFALICQYAGIDCAYIVGNEYENDSHAWNIIYPTDGRDPVVVDVTWDDNLSVDKIGQNHVAKAFFYNYINADQYHIADETMLDFIAFLHESK